MINSPFTLKKPENNCKAIVFDEYGPPDVLSLDAPPGDNDVLIEVQEAW